VVIRTREVQQARLAASYNLSSLIVKPTQAGFGDLWNRQYARPYSADALIRERSVKANLNALLRNEACHGVSAIVVLVAQSVSLDVAMLLRSGKEKNPGVVQDEL
jgi:hypothetical protein